MGKGPEKTPVRKKLPVLRFVPRARSLLLEGREYSDTYQFVQLEWLRRVSVYLAEEQLWIGTYTLIQTGNNRHPVKLEVASSLPEYHAYLDVAYRLLEECGGVAFFLSQPLEDIYSVSGTADSNRRPLRPERSTLAI
jgi:hypothetical protein